MVVVVPSFEAHLANLNFWTQQTLVSGIEQDCFKAALTFEALLAHLRMGGLRMDFLLSLILFFLGLLSHLLLLQSLYVFLVSFCGCFQLLHCVFAPVSSAERASDSLTVLDLVLDPSLHAFGMEVPSALKLTERKIVGVFHRLVANAAAFIRLERHLSN